MEEESTNQPGNDYWSFIEPIWDGVSIYDGPEVFLAQFQKLPPEQGHIFAAHWCQSEICNGGLDQFFWNSTGVLAPEAVVGFRKIGLKECARIVQEAMSFFGEEYPRDRETRQRFLEKANEEGNLFSQLDNQFYEALDMQDGSFAVTADKYVRQTRSKLEMTNPV